MKNLRKMLKNEKGFTLVELVVVLAILGLLIAIAVPKYNDITKNAQKRANEATARTIMSAITMTQAENPTKKSEEITKDDINKFLEGSIQVVIGGDSGWAVTLPADDHGWIIKLDGIQYYPEYDE